MKLTQPTDHQSAITFGKQIAKNIAPRADEANRIGKLPAADVTALTQSGFTTLSIPQEFGGHGLSLHDCLAAILELAQGNPSTALVAGMQMHVFGHESEIRSWNADKFAEFCRVSVEENALFNNIATEPAMGSPSRGQFFKTTAVPSADGATYAINGLKTWSTGGEHLTHLLVKLSIPNDDVALFVVPSDTKGIRWEYTWDDVLSLRASDSHDVHFEDCVISAENIVSKGNTKSKSNVWFPLVMSCIYLGAAIAARDVVIKYALERVPTALGRPIATLPKIQRQIGEMDVQLQAAHALMFAVARDWQGPASAAETDDATRAKFSPRIAAAKTMVTETSRYVTDQALQVAGGISLTKALPLERYFRDVRAGSMQPPSGDTALELIGRAAIDSQK